MRASPDARFIARRLFVTNSIDSLIASLGVNVGAFNPSVDPSLLILAILGGTISLSLMSGFVGVFLSERAERLRELRELERRLGSSLRGSIYAKSTTIIPLYVAIWSSLGMLVFPLVTVTPYLASIIGIVGVTGAFIASVSLALLSLALIGAYLGLITGESIPLSSIRTLGLGALALIAVLMFKTFFKIIVAP